MKNTALRWLGRPLVVTVAALAAACGEGTATPLGPTADIVPTEREGISPPVPDADGGRPTVNLPTGCEKLAVEAGHTLAARTFARGVQVYRWDGSAWAFVEPQAALFADEHAEGKIGTHYAGPWWESASGSKVKGAARERCTPDASAIPWLLLDAVASEGAGIFAGTTFIHRVNTTGGKAPAAPGATVGEIARVPYTADYLFYRSK